MAESIVDPFMKSEIIFNENGVPRVKLTKYLTECYLDELKC